jgi:hypothetical protein
MRLNHLSIILFLGPVLAGASPTADTAAPDPSLVQVQSLSFSGTGCPAGTLSSTFSGDRSLLTFGLDALRAETGPAVPPVKTNCQIHLQIQKPTGWRYGVAGTLWHGWAQLDQNVTAAITSTYVFSSIDGVTSSKFTLDGSNWRPGAVFTLRESVLEGSVIWSSCHENEYLDISNRIVFTRGTMGGRGIIGGTLEGDENIPTTLQTGIVWKTC